MAATDNLGFDVVEGKSIPTLANRRIGDGRYLLQDRLGSGGYSVVYLALDLFAPNKRRVAVKCLLYETDAHKAKIRREISLHGQAASLPGVVDIYHTVEEMGMFFIVLEFCPDGDLFSLVTEARLYLGRDDLIRNVFLQLLDTVHALHKKGIFHRDLKPENVLCCKGGARLRISDFGLATSTERSTNFGCGSYFYMSPECLAGYYSREVTCYSSRAADIWALGVILVNLITSRSPWKSAVLTDPSFARYTRNRHWLRQMLPLSQPAFEFLDRIFVNHGNNLSLTQLRAQFLSIDTFYMSKSELTTADPTARLVAKDWVSDAPTNDILQEDIVEPVDDRMLFEEHISPVRPDSPKTLSPISPNSVLSIESALARQAINNADPTIAEQILTDELRIAEGGGVEYVPSSPSSSSSGSDSDMVITPETLPVHAVEVVPDLPSETLGEKLVAASPAKKYSPVKTVVAAGEKWLSRVRLAL